MAQPAADLLIGWLPEPGSRSNPLRALVFGLVCRCGPVTVDELRRLVGDWTGEDLERRRLRRHVEALRRRGLLARSGDRLVVPGDVAARAWTEGTRLRWLASGAAWRGPAGEQLGVRELYVLAYRDQRDDRRRGVAWVDALEHTAQDLGLHRDTVAEAEGRLRELGVLGVGAHALGKRWRATAGGARSLPRGRHFEAQAQGCRRAGSGPGPVAVAGRSRADLGRRQQDESVQSAKGFALGASLRSASEKSNVDDVRTQYGSRGDGPAWLLDLEARAENAHRRDVRFGETMRRAALLRSLPAPLVNGADGVLAVLTGCGVYVDLELGETGVGLRERRRRLAEDLGRQGIAAWQVLAWALLALRFYGGVGQRAAGRRNGRTVREDRPGIANLGGYLRRSMRSFRGDGERNAHDALSGLLEAKVRRVWGRLANAESVLPRHLRPAPAMGLYELRAVLMDVGEDAPVIPRVRMLEEQFRRAGQRGDLDGALRIVGAATAEGATAQDVVAWAGNLDLRGARAMVARAVELGYATAESAAAVVLDADLPRSIEAHERDAARRAKRRELEQQRRREAVERDELRVAEDWYERARWA